MDVTISTKPTVVWTSGFNGTLTIANNSNINYGSNWSITCTLPENTSLTWCDFMKISSTVSSFVCTPIFSTSCRLNMIRL